MSIFKTRVALAAAAVNNNVMAGSKFEFLARPAVVNVWASQDGVVVAGTGVEIDFTLGNVVVAEDVFPNPRAAGQEGTILKNEDNIGAGIGDAGDRIQLRLRNTDAVNAVDGTLLIEIAEL
jgi:hypothetical protein